MFVFLQTSTTKRMQKNYNIMQFAHSNREGSLTTETTHQVKITLAFLCVYIAIHKSN